VGLWPARRRYDPGGVVVLGDVVLVTVISAIFIGVTMIIAGAFEIIHAFWTKGWGGLAWQISLGLVYVAFGLVLVTRPVIGAIAITYVFGLLLLVSGIVRVVLGFKHVKDADWTMLLSGVFGAAAGLVILSGWPATGRTVLGLLVGIDLVFHGLACLTYAWHPTARTA
jgi:uncharacterized membrane protein HdeD (DUF308 family)